MTEHLAADSLYTLALSQTKVERCDITVVVSIQLLILEGLFIYFHISFTHRLAFISCSLCSGMSSNQESMTFNNAIKIQYHSGMN